MPTMQMKTPQDLFIHELSDIHSGEQIIVQMLEQAQGLVQHHQLQEGPAAARRAEPSAGAADRAGVPADGRAAPPDRVPRGQGLMQSLTEVAQSNPSPEVLEGAVVAGA
jgi:ferritin-like metal-binding protein YciE